MRLRPSPERHLASCWYAQAREARAGASGLRPGDIHVWRFTTDRTLCEKEQLHALLSEDECQRAECFRFDRDRSRFISRRGLLRVLLAQYAECDPARVTLASTPYGKPTLAGTSSGRLQFNASHSDGVALLAVTVDRAVGIDIERHRLDVDCLGLADRFFSHDEVEELRRTDEPLRRAMFFTLWTCKEAWVKARGLGLSFPLRRCRVRVGDRAPQLVEDPEHARERARWWLTQLAAGPDYSAALVADATPSEVRGAADLGPASSAPSLPTGVTFLNVHQEMPSV